MYGQYSRAVSNQERVIVARVRYSGDMYSWSSLVPIGILIFRCFGSDKPPVNKSSSKFVLTFHCSNKLFNLQILFEFQKFLSITRTISQTKYFFLIKKKKSLTNEVGDAQVSRVISAARDTSKRSNLDSKPSNPKLLKLETHNSGKYLSIAR